ncbi:MAG: amidohydrolase family protein [Gaiellales bacterium]|nr:amidohydrolase family protein [Gaiellales bacterium]
MRPLAVVNVNVIPMDGGHSPQGNAEQSAAAALHVYPEQTVVVRDGRIVSVTPSATTTLSPDTLQIEGRGLFLIPGLADMNINLAGYDQPAALSLLLANGVTTARNFGGREEHLDWRGQIARGELDGPTLLTSGPVPAPSSVLGGAAHFIRPLMLIGLAALLFGVGWVTLRTARGRYGFPRPTRRSLAGVAFAALAGSTYFALWVFGLPDVAGPYVALIDSAQEAERAPSAQAQAGFDFTAVAAELPPALYDALLDGAAGTGVRPAGEIPWGVGPLIALTRGGQDLVRVDQLLPLMQRDFDPAHPYAAYELDTTSAGDIARLVATSRASIGSGLFLARQVALQARDVDAILERPETVYLPDEVLRSWSREENIYAARYGEQAEQMKAYAATLAELVPALQEAGALLVAGSSAGAPGVVWGFDLHSELEALVDAGMTPYQALAAATSRAAESVGHTGEWGVISPGARADLVLLGSNPLEDISRVRDIRGVMAAGRWHSRTDLDGLLATLER